MSAYLIVNYTVDDAEAYGQYQQGAGPALKVGSECKVLVLDPASEQVEGEGAGHQTVVLEFESMERAKEIYHSGEYQAVLPTRLGATSKHFAVLVNGFEMPG
ncbi:MAG: DUF1330 domain-containing protein [Actinomycetota bacterium]